MPRTHVVEEGECLASIAQAFGFLSFRTIYDAPENADFRAKRPNPNIIFAGDTLAIPDFTPRTVTVATGQVHTFTVDVSQSRLVIQLNADEAYRFELQVGDDAFSGSIDSSGQIDEEIASDASDGELRVWPARFDRIEDAGEEAVIYPLSIGSLDPADTLSGIQQRLTHLGYHPGPVDGSMGPKTQAAVIEFQEDNPPLSVDGIPGPQSQAVLVQRHGC